MALVLDIQRACVDDGPGIRTTVFLKGCPLSCLWCHNPESQKFENQLFFSPSLCVSCGKCAEVCEYSVHSFDDGGAHKIDFSACRLCGRCVEACSFCALKLAARAMSPEEVMEVVRKDKVYYEASGGGVTISGGEPLSHHDFVLALLLLAKAEGIHTCIETSGFGDKKKLLSLAKHTDLFLFDYKITNPADHVKFIGTGGEVILKNLAALHETGAKIVLRCPIIPAINDTDEHFAAIAELMRKYPNVLCAELMPYHNLGKSKAQSIGVEYTVDAMIPSEKDKKAWREKILQFGGLTDKIIYR